MKPTRIRDLVWLYLVVAVGVGAIAFQSYERLPRFRLSAPLTLVIIAVFETYTALALRARLDGRPGTKPIMPILVARYAALAKASSLAATLAGGVWTGVFAYAVTHRQRFTYADRDSLLGGIGIATAALLVAAALYLERACKVRHPPENVEDPDN
ncbi:MAG: DUF3180 domain-containing protein [Actinomycetota bacterium]